jgi:NAD(P)H-hydrate epimerase
MNVHDLHSLGWPCPTADEMRRVDRHAIETVGLPGRLLMENAGRAVAKAVLERFPGMRRPLVLCGSGNNGGDGFVVARVLRERDDRICPVVRVFGDREEMSDESRTNLELLVRTGAAIAFGGGKGDLEGLAAHADLVVDAIFGVGLTRPVEGELAEMFEALSRLEVPVVALDLPSGVSSDTGNILGAELRADLVVTLGLPKLGLAAQPGESELIVADIGLPAESVRDAGIRQWVLTRGAARRLLPLRPADAHKGTFGHLLIVAGSIGKTGAACLAAEGAIRGGAGLVTVAVPADLNPILEMKLTEAMTLSVPGSLEGALGEEAAPLLAREASARDALVIGPGLGMAPETGAFVEGLLRDLPVPVVIDADGLNVFAGRPEALRSNGLRVLTPHPGELARLVGQSTQKVQEDRVASARGLARATGAVVLLKGARTVIAARDGQVRINPTGGAGLASGGTGDVLAGLVGALLAQGCSPFDAASLGAYLHGLAGDRLGFVGATAGEVAAMLPRVWSGLLREEEPHGGGDLLPFP